MSLSQRTFSLTIPAGEFREESDAWEDAALDRGLELTCHYDDEDAADYFEIKETKEVPGAMRKEMVLLIIRATGFMKSHYASRLDNGTYVPRPQLR